MNRNRVLSPATDNATQSDRRVKFAHRTGHRSPDRRVSTFLFFLPLLAAPLIASAEVPDATHLSLEQLLDVSIIGASKYEQKQGEVTAVVSVITRSEIKALNPVLDLL